MRQFHEHQRAAFAETAKLIALLCIAIAGTIVLSAVAVTYVVAVFFYLEGFEPGKHWPVLYFIFGVSSFLVASIVAIGTGLKLWKLRAGGSVIARELGGRPIEPENDQAERQLLNIVEEMAIAAGIRSPAVFVLDADHSINAFAAGYSRDEAVIGVTRGAIDKLGRDELQGVIAHEYSHILNGDMQLNLRMMGWLHGILAITISAKHLINMGVRSLNHAHARRRSGDGIFLIAIGCALWIVGSVGALMAMLVKAATSRQREYLADAYAVQFTRHPIALADAFKRLAGHGKGSRIRSANALEASHLFLANGCGNLLSGWLASHPPLSERIARLDPDWDGLPLFAETEATSGDQVHNALGLVGSRYAPRQADLEDASDAGNSVASPREQVSELEDNAYAQSVLDALPAELLRLTELPNGPMLICCALWCKNQSPEDTPFGFDERLQSQLEPLLGLLEHIEATQHLLLFDRAVRALETDRPKATDRALLLELCKCGGQENLFQWMWSRSIRNALTPQELPKSRFASVIELGKGVEYLLSYFCLASNTESMAGFAFQRAVASLGLEHATLQDPDTLDWEGFLTSVELAAQLAPRARRDLLMALIRTVAADQEVEPEEVYLLRALCLELGFGPTNLLIGQPLNPGS
ncbi:MAG: M48 family metallopeptidase [Planctomycetota bacterium]